MPSRPQCRHAGLGHQVAFVGRVGEDLRAEPRAVLRHDARDAASRLLHAALLAQAMAGKTCDAGLLHQLVEHRLGDVRLEVPLDVGRPYFRPTRSKNSSEYPPMTSFRP